ncbi:hypothetical protein LDFHOB_09875 [Candidatus Electronema aureum]
MLEQGQVRQSSLGGNFNGFQASVKRGRCFVKEFIEVERKAAQRQTDARCWADMMSDDYDCR